MDHRMIAAGSILIIPVLYFAVSCQPRSIEDRVEAHCGRCHATPDPSLLPKKVWEDDVLPAMSYYFRSDKARPGHPFLGLSMEEQVVVQNSGLFPDQDLINDEEWEDIVEYYVTRAPESLNLMNDDPGPLQSIFYELPITGSTGRPPMISMTRINNDTIWTGNGYGEVRSYQWRNGMVEMDMIPGFTMPVDLIFRPVPYLLDMGYIMPNDRRLGRLHRFDDGEWKISEEGLRRPVTMIETDEMELVVGEFGHLTGSMSMGKSPEMRTDLVAQPGCVKLIYSDMDGNGDREIVALFGQGDEGVVICLPCESGWCCQKALTLHPLFGSSDLEVADIDGDGLLDLILASGDNADYSIVDKNHHGVYFYRNTGSFQFSFMKFLPMPGCTNIEVADFDGDGDQDILASAFFPVMTGEGHTRALTYFENVENEFISRSFELAGAGRWLVLDSGDLDKDGDTDAVVGSFSLHPSPVDPGLSDSWKNEGPELLILENKTHP